MIAVNAEESEVLLSLAVVQREVKALRAEIDALDLMPDESAYFLGVLQSIESSARGISANFARKRGH